jgi:hypothetical protein
MSLGGVFTIVLRDERFDQFYTASDYLRERLNKIRKSRKAAGYTNPQPTFADLGHTHKFFLNETYKPFVANASEYFKVKSSGDGTIEISESGGTASFTFPINGHFTSDMLFHVRIEPVGSATGDTFYRYCALPGGRLFKDVTWDSGEIKLDNFTPDDTVFHGNFHVDPKNREGWLRGLGQQVPQVAEYQGNGYTGVFNYMDGPQTLKRLQPAIDMMVPLQFSNSQAPQNAVLNDFIANTQRRIVAELEDIDKIIGAFNSDGDSVALPFSKLKMSIELYVNNIFVNPEIHDIFASRCGFSLFRTHQRHLKSVTNPEDSIKLSQLKFPAEYLHVGFRDKQNANDFDHWPLFGTNTRPSTANENALLIPAMIFNPAPAPPAVNVGVCELVCRVGKISSLGTLTPIVDQLGVTAHSITVYPTLPTEFYTNYLPNRYPQRTPITSPHDTSTHLIPFSNFPGDAQPSGYYNLSSGREFHLNYRSSFISNTTPTQLVVTMSALNFMVRKGDKLNLRYSI